MSKKPVPTEQRVVLPNVKWQQFESLLAELGEGRSTRLTYDRGKLEMLNPTEEHDRLSRLFESLLLLVADEMDLNVTAISPVMLKHADLSCGVELDSCYYLQQSVDNHRVIDLTQTIAPNLVVEVVVTKSAIDKLALYSALGIPEVWRYAAQAGENALKGELQIYQLEGNQHIDRCSSLAFPFLTADRVLEFLGHSETVGLAQALRLLRTWLNQEGLTH